MPKQTFRYSRWLTATVAAILPLAGLTLAGMVNARTADHEVRRVPVTFSGGHETDPRDHGRPVILVASALGVPPEVFRQAFAGVHPAPPGVQPTGDEQRANKAVLLSALAPYGVTNERLDEVSNHYRYQRNSGGIWTNTPASAYAVVKGEKIVRYVVTASGCGYTSTPLALVPGLPNANPTVKLSFSKDFSRNGMIAGIIPGKGGGPVNNSAITDPMPPPPPTPPPPPPPQ